MARRHQEQMSQLSARVAELDADNRKLREAKYELDSKVRGCRHAPEVSTTLPPALAQGAVRPAGAQVSELSHRLGSTEGANRSLEDEVNRLRASCTQLGGDKAERDVAVQELRTKLGAAEEKVQRARLRTRTARLRSPRPLDQAPVVNAPRRWLLRPRCSSRSARACATSRPRCARTRRASTSSRSSWRRSRRGSRTRSRRWPRATKSSTSSRCARDDRISEGRTPRRAAAQASSPAPARALARPQSDLRLAKEKSKRKQAILVRQEEELGAREQALAAIRQELAQAQQQLDAAKAEVRAAAAWGARDPPAHANGNAARGSRDHSPLRGVACAGVGVQGGERRAEGQAGGQQAAAAEQRANDTLAQPAGCAPHLERNDPHPQAACAAPRRPRLSPPQTPTCVPQVTEAQLGSVGGHHSHHSHHHSATFSRYTPAALPLPAAAAGGTTATSAGGAPPSAYSRGGGLGAPPLASISAPGAPPSSSTGAGPAAASGGAHAGVGAAGERTPAAGLLPAPSVPGPSLAGAGGTPALGGGATGFSAGARVPCHAERSRSSARCLLYTGRCEKKCSARARVVGALVRRRRRGGAAHGRQLGHGVPVRRQRAGRGLRGDGGGDQRQAGCCRRAVWLGRGLWRRGGGVRLDGGGGGSGGARGCAACEPVLLAVMGLDLCCS